MNIKKICVAVFFAMGVYTLCAQQAINPTQYGAIPVLQNTAASFLRPAGEVSVLARQQWRGIQGAPELYTLSATLPTFGSVISAGINVKHGTVAVERSTDAVAFVGKSIKLTANSHLAMSIGVGASIYKGNFSGLDSDDPAFRDDINEANGLFSIGLLYYRPDSYYVGVSVPKLSFSRLGITNFTNQSEKSELYHLTGGVVIPLGKMFDLKPAGLVAWSENLKPQVNLSAMLFLQKTLGLGVDFRTYGNMAGMVQLNARRISLGYSYQFNLSGQTLTKGIINNTHELGINYGFGSGVLGLL